MTVILRLRFRLTLRRVELLFFKFKLTFGPSFLIEFRFRFKMNVVSGPRFAFRFVFRWWRWRSRLPTRRWERRGTVGPSFRRCGPSGVVKWRMIIVRGPGRRRGRCRPRRGWPRGLVLRFIPLTRPLLFDGPVTRRGVVRETVRPTVVRPRVAGYPSRLTLRRRRWCRRGRQR